jgi:predicted DNA-binding antitoxin AbrB/MazE fold protein
LERWQQLLNPGTEEMNSLKTHEGSKNNLELEEPTYEEINEIIKNMKSNKAAGPDEILTEFIKKSRSHTKTENTSINSEDMETIKNTL